MLTRAPYTMREKRSRPSPSLPIRKYGVVGRLGGEQMPDRGKMQ